MSAAANISLPEDMKVSLTDSSAPDGYPISGFTWIILYKEQKYGDRTEDKAKTLLRLVWWMTHEGQEVRRAVAICAALQGRAGKGGETPQVRYLCRQGGNEINNLDREDSGSPRRLPRLFSAKKL